MSRVRRLVSLAAGVSLLTALAAGCAESSSVNASSNESGEDASSDVPAAAETDRDVTDEALPEDVPAELDSEDDEPFLGDVASEEPGTEPDGAGVDATSGTSVLVLAVGDIANCTMLGYAGLIRDPHELTADLVENYPSDTPILTLGDHVYSNGTAVEFAVCYAKGWGRYRDRTHPCPGNHDYNTDDAEAYYDYFGARAGHPDRGYYAFELGEWQVLSLNSNCGDLPGDGCDAESLQYGWLQQQLASGGNSCTLAYWHHPRWSSDRAGNSVTMEPFVQALYDADADLVLVGHAHNYERFAPQTPQGAADGERGLRQFVVGTGGADLRPLVTEQPNSEVFIEDHGLLELTLHPDRYDWRFVDLDGVVRDSGTERCH